MRFYDINFGSILVDGVDIRKYNIKQLRQRMGLVMQEPTLFNYSIKENVLYGNQTAPNAKIIEACEIANARVFIESDELEHAVEDNVKSLREAMESQLY
jgi:ABC-type multidrug transport system fused ATPase/permease subunit